MRSRLGTTQNSRPNSTERGKKKELAGPFIPTIFPGDIRPKESLTNKKGGVVDMLTLAARQLRRKKLISDVPGVRTRLNKGEDEGMIDCVQAVKMRM